MHFMVCEYYAQDGKAQANEIEKAAKDQDVKYKIKESKGLDKTSAELSSDRTGVQAELDAVSEYLSKIEDECIAKTESYEARKARRDSELAGLKEVSRQEHVVGVFHRVKLESRLPMTERTNQRDNPPG